MRKTLTYILKSLPFLVLLLILAAVSPAHAGWWSDLTDAAVDAAGEAAAWALGIDTEDNCVPPTSETTNCLFCPMFKILFNAGSIVAAKSYSAFSSELGQLVLVFLSVSLALIILRNIAAMGSKDPGALLNDIFKKTFVCIVIYIIIAKDYYNVLNLTLTPIFETGFSFVKSGNTTCASAGGIIGYSGTAGSGGAGGQNVNKVETGVRLRYNYKDPDTGETREILIENTETRSQLDNRENAMRLLRSMLYDMELQRRMAEQQKIESNKKKIEWGSQIRSYVFDDRRVKDHRTNFQTSDVGGVMDGKIDGFIKAYLMEFGGVE